MYITKASAYLLTNERLKSASVNMLIIILFIYSFFGVFFVLYQLNYLPFLNTNYTFQNIQSDSGKAYKTDFVNPRTYNWVEYSYRIYENGIQLQNLYTPYQSVQNVIREIGNGSYTIKDNQIIFAPLNNASLTNQIFTINMPRIVSLDILNTILFSLIFTIGLLYYLISPATRTQLNTANLCIVLSVIFLQLIMQLKAPHSLVLYPDSQSYILNAESVLNLHWTFFGYRPPGYSIFLILVKLLTNSKELLSINIRYAQTLLTFAAAYTLIYACFKYSKLLATIVGPLLSVLWLNNHQLIIFNWSIMSDSELCSLFTFYVAFLLMCLHPSNKPTHWVLLSITTAFAILVKPAALFLIPLGLILLLYMMFNSAYRSISKIFALLFPAGFLLGSFMLYNLLIYGFFGLSIFGPINLLYATGPAFAFLNYHPNPNFAQASEVTKNHLEENRSLEVLNNSWDYTQLRIAYAQNYNWFGKIIIPILVKDVTTEDKLYFVTKNKILWDTCLYLIKQKPILYLKFIYMSLANYYTCFFNIFSGVIFIVITFVTSIVFVKSRGKNSIAFLILALIAFMILHSLTICLVEISLIRYIYNIVYLPYLIIVLFFIFLIPYVASNKKS